MFISGLDNKHLSVTEKPLVKTILPKFNLKQVPKPPNLSFDIENEESFISPIGRINSHNHTNCNISKRNAINNGIGAIDAEKLLNDSHEKNSRLSGWSAKEIAKHRNEIQQTFRPETLEAFKNLRIKRQKKETIDAKLLTKINDICNEKLEKNEVVKTVEKMETDEDKPKDLSFLPINPNNNYVNMNTVEMDKLEWMKYIDEKADKAKLKSIRFHISGVGLPPDEEEEELFGKPSTEFDPFADSLHHHGEEPSRKGYTISELFWLARSSFSMQRSLAVSTLINMVNKSRNLEHVYHFNMPTVTQSLVDCGIIFLARWLIDESTERQQHLHQALELLHVLLVDGNQVNSDGVVFNWPDCRVALNLPQLIDRAVLDKQKARLALPLSEQTEQQDDIMMAEDIVTCLVNKTKFLERFSFLLVKKNVNLDSDTMELFIGIIERVVRHSLEMACSVANDHEDLLIVLIKSQLLSGLTKGTAGLIRLVRCLCQTSESIAHKLTRDQLIIQTLYAIITDTAGTGIDSVPVRDKIEAVRLVTVFIARGIHAGPIETILPIIIDQLTNRLTSDQDWSSALTQSFITCLAVFLSSNSVVSSHLYFLIESVVSSVQSKLLRCLIVHPAHHPILASMIHLINNFLSHQYTRSDISRHSVATYHYQNFLSVLLSSGLLDQLLQKLPKRSVLAYEHRNTGHEFICLDLVNLLHNPTCLAVKTRNPKFIDIEPFFIDLDPSFSLLSAICHSISLIASARVSPRFLTNFSQISDFQSNLPHLIDFINYSIADCPIDRVVNVSVHSLIVQLQLEAVSQLIISVISALEWASVPVNGAVAITLYKAAIRILPLLGPNLFPIGIELINRLIFNPTVIKSIKLTIDPAILELLLESIPNIRAVYETFIPRLIATENPKLGLLQPINDRFVPIDWIDYPFIKRCKKKSTDKSTDEEEPIDLMLSEQSIVALLAFISFLETGNIIRDKIVPTAGIRRLCNILITNDWMDNLLQHTARSMLTNFLNQYLTDISLIDLSCPRLNPTKFIELYNQFCEQYFSLSMCDALLANLVLFPCAMRFPLEYRAKFWKNNCDKMLMIVVDISESIVSIEEYLQPEEINIGIIEQYWNALKNGYISEYRNQLLYWICVHHLNRFVFNQSLGSEMATQSLIGHAITNPQWQHKSWIQHLKLYKHFVGTTVAFYDELPGNRVQHLDRLRQLAEFNRLYK